MRKTCRVILKVWYILWSIPVVVLIGVLRPVVTIRLGRLDGSRIGAMYFADWYLSEQAAGWHKGRYFDVFYLSTIDNVVPNRQWLKMWRRVLRIAPWGNFVAVVDKIQARVFKDGRHKIPLEHVMPKAHEDLHQYNNKKIRCILSYDQPHIYFTQEEECEGRAALREMGIPEGKKFVCFHARDSAYLDAIYPQMSWNYHDYRDSSIQNYLSAVCKLTERGYFAIRMGAVVKEKISPPHPAVIDYATNGRRTDFLDIYLGAKCRFFICSDVGISIIPEMFRVPMVYTNWVPLWRIFPWVFNGLVIFKKLYLTTEKRILSFKEIIHSDIGNCADGDVLKKRGIEVIENTPQEIEDVVLEMEDRLKGVWQTTPEDEDLQQRFWALFGPEKVKSPDLRIGTKFLRQHSDLLLV